MLMNALSPNLFYHRPIGHINDNLAMENIDHIFLYLFYFIYLLFDFATHYLQGVLLYGRIGIYQYLNIFLENVDSHPSFL